MEYPFASNFSMYSYFGMDFAIFTLKIKKLTMKKTLGIATILVSLFLVSFTTRFYSIEDVVAALKSGNAAQLSKYFDGRVDISLPNKSDNYSKSQAEIILKDFFASNGVKSFQVKHKGEQNGAQFCIGTLVTKNGTYRTKFYMKQKGDQQVVQEMGFELLTE
jgi:hypothetical protein